MRIPELRTTSWPIIGYIGVGGVPDVPDATYAASLNDRHDGDDLIIDAEVSTDDDGLLRLIESGDVAHKLAISCSSTALERHTMFKGFNGGIRIPFEDVSGTLNVNVTAHALRPLRGHKVQRAHPLFGTKTFDIVKQGMLAVSRGQCLDLFTKMQESPFQPIVDNRFSVIIGDNKIMIGIPEGAKDKWSLLDNSPAKTIPYRMVMPQVLMQLLVKLYLLPDEDRPVSAALDAVRRLAEKTKADVEAKNGNLILGAELMMQKSSMGLGLEEVFQTVINIAKGKDEDDGS